MSLISNLNDSEINLRFFIGLIFSISVILSFGYSPFFLYFLSFLGLLFFSPLLKQQLIRYSFILITIISLLLIIGSRNYYDEMTSDLKLYHSIFYELSNEYNDFYGFFGDGLEVGWPILYSYVAKWFDLSPIQLALFNTIICLVIIIAWIETKIKPLVGKNEFGIFYFLFFIFINLGVLGFLQRQAITVGILLFALTSKKNLNFILIVFLASVFHLSSIIVGLVIYICKNLTINKVWIIKLLIISFLFRFVFISVLLFFLNLLGGFEFITHKLNFFVNTELRVSTLRYVILSLSLFFILILTNKVDENLKVIYNFALISCIFIVMFVGIPLFADRIFMVSMVVYGLFYYLFFYRKYPILALVFAVLYFIIVSLEKFNVIGELSVGDFYWARYNYIGEKIFYYLDKI
ncbi:EpsG family protein [Acinetobacter indicus]|uniref:EpsG family protein n=1 Tax=Acinetobacter indicus TaxID=756892 RepID=UPI000CEBC724|nr:EpsG family protein [Acinetobacter indicus]